MKFSAALLGLALTLGAVPTCVWAEQSVEIKQKDGATWRGHVSDTVEIRTLQSGNEITVSGTISKVADLYIMVDTEVVGRKTQKAIFKADIVSIKSVGGGASNATPRDEADLSKPGTAAATPSAPAGGDKDIPRTADGKPLGVFVLPLTGTVGEEFRHDEIEAVAKEADKYGPGQIIVLEIESGGGLGIEMEQIHFTIADIRKRHRVVAWIKEAISAASATASNCSEIYFYTNGAMGAMTGFAGTVSLQGAELRKWMEAAGDWMETGGRSRYIAYAMIDDAAMLSYDKDPVTGEVTWYNDMSGKTVLSTPKTNLVFTASTAMDSKFADGIADTPEELAKLLNLPKWYEISDYGRKIHEDWVKTVAKCKEEVPLLFARLDYKGAGSGSGKVVLGEQMKIINQLISWWGRCPNECFLMGVPSKEELKKWADEIRWQLAKMKEQEKRTSP